MLVYFNEKGQIERQLEYGQLAYLSTTNYTIFVVQKGYEPQEGDTATLSLKRPDGTLLNAEIFGRLGNISFSVPEGVQAKDCLPFVEGEIYRGFRFEINDMHILNQFGTWRGTVSVNPNNNEKRYLSGILTVYVNETEINIDGFEMSYTEYIVLMNKMLELEARFKEEVITSEIVENKINTALASGTKQIKVPVSPIADNDAASKDYVDYVNNNTNSYLNNEIQNVRDVAAGKKSAYVSSVNYVAPTEISFYDYAYFRQDGTRIESYEDFLAYVDDAGMSLECANADFRDTSAGVVAYGKYLIVDRNQNDGRIVVRSVDDFFKRGDELYFIELLPVLDRWYSGSYTFSQLDTKVDLSTVVHKSGDEEISGVKTFANGFTLPAGATINTVGQVSKITVWGGSVVFDKNLVAGGNNTYDLGNTSNKWKDLFLSHQANIGNWWIRSLYDNLYFGFSENNNKIQLSATELKCDVDITAWANQNLGTNSNPFNDVNISGEIKVKDSVAQYKKVQCLTQEDYDALSTKDENVLYLIKE